jgi:hypothetical protein
MVIGEWADATPHFPLAETAIGRRFVSLAITYFTAVVPNHRETTRRALAWIGALNLFPRLASPWCRELSSVGGGSLPLPMHLGILGFGLSFVLPLLLAPGCEAAFPPMWSRRHGWV